MVFFDDSRLISYLVTKLLAMATVKISEETYKKLNSLRANFVPRLGRPVSVDEAIDFCYEAE